MVRVRAVTRRIFSMLLVVETVFLCAVRSLSFSRATIATSSSILHLPRMILSKSESVLVDPATNFEHLTAFL